MGTATRGTAPIRARELLRRITVSKPIGVEIGVDKGAMSVELLTRPDLFLYMVDPWSSGKSEEYRKSGDYHAWLSDAENDRNFNYAVGATEFAGRRRSVLRMTSLEAADYIKGNNLNFVFIDADHSYEGVKSDIAAWMHKILPGGILSGHDYADPANPQFGVKRAVDEAVLVNGWKLELGDNYTWFVQL